VRVNGVEVVESHRLKLDIQLIPTVEQTARTAAKNDFRSAIATAERARN